MEPVIEMLTPMTANNLGWADLTPSFYAAFWSLTMTDLQVPSNAYAKQITQLRMQMVNIEENNDLVSPARQ